MPSAARPALRLRLVHSPLPVFKKSGRWTGFFFASASHGRSRANPLDGEVRSTKTARGRLPRRNEMKPGNPRRKFVCPVIYDRLFLAVSPQNQAQNHWMECGLRDRKNPAFSKIAKSSNFYGFGGGRDPLRFRAQHPTGVCKNRYYPFFQ